MVANPNYVLGRKKYQRPQALIWSDAEPTIVTTTSTFNGVTTTKNTLVPTGYEVGSSIPSGTTVTDEFIILSDHNRSPIDITNNRIEQRQRMANGTMRSYFIADKLNISLSWSNLPSRGFAVYPDFSQTTGIPDIITSADAGKPSPYTYYANKSEQYTVDGGAGGGELLDWYENHTGPFWVMLSYDKYNNFADSDAGRSRLGEYSQAIQMYISGFDYSVVKRGGSNFDMWDVSVTLEEV